MYQQLEELILAFLSEVIIMLMVRAGIGSHPNRIMIGVVMLLPQYPRTRARYARPRHAGHRGVERDRLGRCIAGQ